MITKNASNGDSADMPPDDSTESSGETAILPLTIIGDQQVEPGDSISLKVVSVDDNGITVEYDHAPEGEEPPQEDGLDYMARTGAKRPPPMMES